LSCVGALPAFADVVGPSGLSVITEVLFFKFSTLAVRGSAVKITAGCFDQKVPRSRLTYPGDCTSWSSRLLSVWCRKISSDCGGADH